MFLATAHPLCGSPNRLISKTEGSPNRPISKTEGSPNRPMSKLKFLGGEEEQNIAMRSIANHAQQAYRLQVEPIAAAMRIASQIVLTALLRIASQMVSTALHHASGR